MSAFSAHLRRRVETRAGNRCEYCHLHRRGQVGRFPIDHVVPRVANGSTAFENLALACPHCNARKWAHTSAVDPISGTSVLLFNPRTQIWTEHFRWGDGDRDILDGVTAEGRATVERLEMNHPDLVAIRRLLRELGVPVE